MAKAQVNLKLDAELVREVERLVREGYFPTKTEAFTQALKLLIKQYKLEELRTRLARIREGTESLPSTTEAVVESHEEDA